MRAIAKEVKKITTRGKRVILSATQRYYLSKYGKTSPGTLEWLIGTEIKYGGLATNIPRNKVSSKDPRTNEQIRSGGMTGGDRMLHHGYAKKYSEYLLPYTKQAKPVTMAEIGILKGTGLAIWCDLFFTGRIIGFDIDLGHTKKNMSNLKNLGAFTRNEPELYEFDQFLDNTRYLETLLRGDKIDICIDDGAHSDEAILTTMKSMVPFLADNFVYIVEDNKDVHKKIRVAYPYFIVDNQGMLTVVARSKAQ